jgi:hypothetical protein
LTNNNPGKLPITNSSNRLDSQSCPIGSNASLCGRRLSSAMIYAIPDLDKRSGSLDSTDGWQCGGDELSLLVVTMKEASYSGSVIDTYSRKGTVAINLSRCTAAQLSAKRRLVLVPRDLPTHLRGLWCRGRICDFLIYSRELSTEQIMNALLLLSKTIDQDQQATVGMRRR